ncbi:MAG: LysE/ArgO family amino acid transporter [Mangrovicoccus sp.]
MFSALLIGFSSGFSLILAIGAQNAFVLRQGLLQRHVLPLVLLCACSDAILILIGVSGFGAIMQKAPWFPAAMAYGGAAFLFVYGALRVKAAVKGKSGLTAQGFADDLRSTLLTGAAFTWLNPHVYLDTMGLLGAISTQFIGPERWLFALGATLASFTFFFSLGFGAARLAPIMASPGAWRILDLTIAAVMITLATGLLIAQY